MPLITRILPLSRGSPPCGCLVSQSCLTLCDCVDCTPPDCSVHRDSPGKNTGVDCHALLQGIFPTQESNWGLLHCRQILYQLSYQGSPKSISLLSHIQLFVTPWTVACQAPLSIGILQVRILEWVALPFSRGSS